MGPHQWVTWEQYSTHTRTFKTSMSNIVLTQPAVCGVCVWGRATRDSRVTLEVLGVFKTTRLQKQGGQGLVRHAVITELAAGAQATQQQPNNIYLLSHNT